MRNLRDGFYLTASTCLRRQRGRSRGLRSDVDADGYVRAVVLAVGDIGVGADFHFALDGRVLVNREGHGLGRAWRHLRILHNGGLRRGSESEREGTLLN